MDSARTIVRDGKSAFEEISRRTDYVVDAQGEISMLTGWNDRYTGYLAERTQSLITDQHIEQYRLTDALRSHQAWIRRIHDLIGVEDPNVWEPLRGDLVDDVQCDFGIWLTQMGRDPEIAGFECYGEIVGIHHSFHDELKNILDGVQQTRRALESQDLNRLQEISQSMVSLLDKMDTRMFERERKAEAAAKAEHHIT